MTCLFIATNDTSWRTQGAELYGSHGGAGAVQAGHTAGVVYGVARQAQVTVLQLLNLNLDMSINSASMLQRIDVAAYTCGRHI